MSYSKKLLHSSFTALLISIVFLSVHVVRAEDEKEFPTPTCSPRPACLDLPRFPCKPPEPIGGFCPPTPTLTDKPTETPKPSPTTTPTPTQTPIPTLTPTITLTPTATLTPTPACPRKPEGDANCDNGVDLLDFEIWRQEFTAVTPPPILKSDFNPNLKADLLDFEIWRHTFTIPAPTATPEPSATSVPTATPTPTPLVYYRVFVSSQSHDGNFGGLAGADTACQQLADASSYTSGGIYKAWLSTLTVDSKNHIRPNTSKPYSLVNGTQLAPSWSAINDTLSAAPNITEQNVTNNGYTVWTGYFQMPGCNDWTSADSSLTGQLGIMTDGRYWTSNTTGYQYCNYQLPFYCFETDH
ncbi:MAG: DUF1554 domain-containing protein [Patescibacteria group bacterium]|jgi:hypothetical protein